MVVGATASNVELSHHHPAPSPSAKRLTGGGITGATLAVAGAGETNWQRNTPPAGVRVLTKLTINTAPGPSTPMQGPAASPTGSPPPPVPASPAAAAAAASPGGAARITPSTQSSMLPPSPAAAAPSSMDRSTSLKLEAVMRRNTKACIFTLVISTTNMAYCSAAMIVNDPYMRKLVSPLALIDSCLIVSMLCYVLSGSSKPSGEAAAAQPIVTAKDREGHITSTARPSGVAQPSKGGWVGGGGGGASRVGGGGGVQPVVNHAAAPLPLSPGPARRADPMIVEPDLEAGGAAAVAVDPRDLEQVDELGAHDDAGIED